MAHYTAEVLWQRGEQDFLGNTYSRRHTLRFDGGVEVPASSSPHVVPLPMSDASAVDPEEMFVASLSNCHMLWFLTMAVKRKFVVDRYFDAAVGTMEKNAEGKMAMTVSRCGPRCIFRASTCLRASRSTRCTTARMKSASSRIRSRPRCAASRCTDRLTGFSPPANGSSFRAG